MLTRQRDLSGDLDGRAADQRAASRSQNVRLVDLAGGRGRCSGDGGGRAGGRRARYHHRGHDTGDLAVGRCRGGRRDRLPIDDLDFGNLITTVARGVLQDLGFEAEAGERSGSCRAQAETHLRQEVALGAGLLQEIGWRRRYGGKTGRVSLQLLQPSVLFLQSFLFPE